MAAISRENNYFKRSFYISISIHVFLFILILLSPYLPKSGSKGMVHYVNVISLGGGGGGGGSQQAAMTELSETEVPQRERLQDLSTPQKIERQKPPAMTYPVEKPKRDKTSDKPKKAVIKKAPSTKTKKKSPAQSGTGSGSGRSLGIGIGGGSGSGGTGFGPGFGSGTGLSNIPYAYFLQNLSARISSEWMTAQIRTGLSGEYHTVVQFRIYRDGRISDPEIKERSGVRTMDMSAVRAVRNAAPFPPLPPEYEDEYMQITLYFEHKK